MRQGLSEAKGRRLFIYGGGQNPPLSEDDPEYKVFFLAQLPKCWDYSAPPHVVSGAGDGAQVSACEASDLLSHSQSLVLV